MEIIAKNSLIFKTHINEDHITSNMVRYAFADNQILAKLTKRITLFDQLLITNDRSLATDACKINQLQSCNGKFIRVCYINPDGELYKSVPVTSKINTEDDYSFKELFQMIWKKFNKSLFNKTQVQGNYSCLN